MNVVLVSHGFPPSGFGDHELWTQTLAEELSRRTEVHVFLARHDPAREPHEIDRYLHPRYEVTTVHHPARSWWDLPDTYQDRAVAYSFDHYLSKVRPDVVHIQSLQGVSAAVIEMAKKRNIPVVVTLNDFWPLCGRTARYARWAERCDEIDLERCHRCLFKYQLASQRLRRWSSFRRRLRVAYKHHLWGGTGIYAWRAARAAIRAARDARPFLPIGKRSVQPKALQSRDGAIRAALQKADLLLTPSRFAAEEFVRAGVTGPTMRAIQLGASGTVKPRSLDADRPVRLGFVDSWSLASGLHTLIEAFSELPAGAAELQVFGKLEPTLDVNDHYGEMVTGLIERPGIQVRGSFEARVLSRRLSDLDVLVVPTLGLTNAPLPLREALAGGLPVIATEQGGTAELVNRVGGACLIPADHPAALKKALERAVRDPAAFRTDVGTASEIPSLEKTVEEHLEIYERLTGRASTPVARPELSTLAAASNR